MNPIIHPLTDSERARIEEIEQEQHAWTRKRVIDLLEQRTLAIVAIIRLNAEIIQIDAELDDIPSEYKGDTHEHA